MERWLLLSNCQTFGLANSLSLMAPSLSIDALDLWTFQTDPARFMAAMPSYDRVVVHPDIARMPGYDMSGARHLNHLPSIDFGAYHPDFAYFSVNGNTVSGPAASYQSTIVVAAYNEGLNTAATRAFFTARTYERCGYHDDWAPQRNALVDRFTAHGVDISALFARWGRQRAFMYSVNHPRIEAVHDVAAAFLKALDVPTVITDVRPSDNLVSGPCLPIYDEVADRLGVRGSYLFKLSGEYRYLTLEEFIERSFAAYADHAPDAIQPDPPYRARYDRVRAYMRGEA